MEWTSRLWIIQEQLLNAETLILRGSQLLRWEVVAFITVLFSLDLLPVDVVDFWRDNPDHRHFHTGPIKCAEVVFYILVERLIRLDR